MHFLISSEKKVKGKEDDPLTIWDAALVKGVENCQTLHEWLTIIQSAQLYF